VPEARWKPCLWTFHEQQEHKNKKKKLNKNNKSRDCVSKGKLEKGVGFFIREKGPSGAQGWGEAMVIYAGRLVPGVGTRWEWLEVGEVIAAVVLVVRSFARQRRQTAAGGDDLCSRGLSRQAGSALGALWWRKRAAQCAPGGGFGKDDDAGVRLPEDGGGQSGGGSDWPL
jgi:hypothetical protein